jgi:hypothetical protein
LGRKRSEAMNGDQAAFPNHHANAATHAFIGMTKRELMATVLTAGLLSDPNTRGTTDEIVDYGVEAADKLLERLAKRN